ncbi:hypothetical protein ACFC0C_21925 [Streptomyces sp. NPDC056178]|uniref:hypothetical protein n=1 Tax=unclassified Streptomyces TaxID=2593676 RepID=UPI0035DA487B
MEEDTIHADTQGQSFPVIVAMVAGMPRALFPQLADQTYATCGEGLAIGVLL